MFYIIVKTSKDLTSSMFWTGSSESEHEWSTVLQNAHKFFNKSSADYMLHDLSFDTPDKYHLMVNSVEME